MLVTQNNYFTWQGARKYVTIGITFLFEVLCYVTYGYKKTTCIEVISIQVVLF